jgi:hypothetical protein
LAPIVLVAAATARLDEIVMAPQGWKEQTIYFLDVEALDEAMATG